MKRIGILSDTHGLLRPEAAEALRHVDHILHAGDVGSSDVLRQLQSIAPVTAVRGNVDTGHWGSALPLTAEFLAEHVRFFLIHKIADLPAHAPPAETDVIVYGHSHKPSEVWRNGICYLNPGSAGKRRFSLPITLVTTVVEGRECRFSFVPLTPEQ